MEIKGWEGVNIWRTRWRNGRLIFGRKSRTRIRFLIFSREYEDIDKTHPEADVSANSEYGGRGIQEIDKEGTEKNEKYVVEDNFVVDTRGNKNYSKITLTTKNIGRY